jgi:Zn-dependent oligopeptidase
LLLSQFVNDLEAKLRPVGINDRKVLLALKKKEHEEKGLSFDGEFYLWDYRYYDRKYIEESLSLDDMVVKEYFPVSTVVPAILEIYQNLLGVQFEAIKNASTWHDGMFVQYVFSITLNLTDRKFSRMRRCPSVFCLGERCQRCLWFRWILLPGSVPSRYAFIFIY